MDIPQYNLPRTSRTFEHAIRTHCIFVAPDVTPADLMNPLLWEHMAERFEVGMEIIVKPLDHSYRFHGEVVAVDSAGHWAALRQISLAEGVPFKADTPDNSGYSYNKDPVMGYRVLRGNVVVARDLPDEAAAISEMERLKGVGKTVRARAA